MTEQVAQERWFAIIPKSVIYHPDLTGNDIRVYASLSERAGTKLHAWPGVRRIAGDVHMSPTTVQASIDRLERVGAVEIERRKGRSNDYWLPRDGVPDSDTPAYQKLEQGVPDSDTELDPITRPRELEPAAASTTELPAVRWAKRWAGIRGVAWTPVVERTWVPQVQQLIRADVDLTEGLLQAALEEGIRNPSGWAFVAGNVKPVLPDCGECGNDRLIWTDADGYRVDRDDPDASVGVRCPECSEAA